jgi:hypothetical protein
MVKRYYLSEMAVSDMHGGGLTLQRILGEDLDSFNLFVHLDQFATKHAPIIKRLADRQLNLHHLFRAPHRAHGSARYYADRALSLLRLRTFSEWSQERWARRCVDHVLHHVNLDDSRWLVVPQHVASVHVMNRLWRRRPVQYVTWLMDDHVIEWRNGWRYSRRFEAEFAFHLQHAQQVFAISPAMARLYRDRFRVNAEVLFGSADAVSPPVYPSPSIPGPVRLCYFGAIRAWQRDALERLVAHLGVLDARLDLFGLQDPPAQLRCQHVSVCAPVPANEVVPRMREYDGVVIPASFSEDHRNLTELNIATKMSECFASGTVPVVVAPAYAAMAKFAHENGGAVVISDFGDSAQLTALRNLKNVDFRARILGDARRVADNVCSTRAMRRTWTAGWEDGVAVIPSSAYPPTQCSVQADLGGLASRSDEAGFRPL